MNCHLTEPFITMIQIGLGSLLVASSLGKWLALGHVRMVFNVLGFTNRHVQMIAATLLSAIEIVLGCALLAATAAFATLATTVLFLGVDPVS